ncbi:MAG: endolytic transglycosylase MltG [Candidatus Pacebacteria bacterium]|nr:endolytic transglycosylase MltG [Candidatus Paceibacterota bacterium]
MPAPRYPQSLMPHPMQKKRKKFRGLSLVHTTTLLAGFLIGVGFFSLPVLVGVDLALEAKAPPKPNFTITVDPERQVIIEDPAIEALLVEEPETLSASVGLAREAFYALGAYVSNLPVYSLVAGVSGNETKVVVIYPGSRKEEVAAAFGSVLGWTKKQQLAFLANAKSKPPVLEEGQFQPGTYTVTKLTTPDQVQTMLYERFSTNIVERYSEETAKRVSLYDALTIASLLEREAGGWHDMRDISGILWNRMWGDMNLQLDASLQYAKADTQTGAKGVWWPKVVPKDKYIKSAYNTYANAGLPPGPISNPSIAAVVAALNPKKTDCMFYFHDDNGTFHCSATYKEHVASLKKIYGRGK